MDASYKIQRGIHVHLIQFFMCPEFWVHINPQPLFFLRVFRQLPLPVSSKVSSKLRKNFALCREV